MQQAAITVRRGARTVLHEVVSLTGPVHLGEHESAAVSFPGASLTVAPTEGGWAVQGTLLHPGKPVVMEAGPWLVEVELFTPTFAVPRIQGGPDPRLLVATLAVMLLGAWVDTGRRVAHTEPEVVAELQAWLFATPVETERELMLQDTAVPPDAWPPAERVIRLEP